MRFISFLFVFIATQVFALDELKTKQSLSKIRYISNDGKVTYYQKYSGELQMSTNYNFANLIKKNKNTQFLVNATDTEKRIVIEVDNNHFSVLDLRKNNEIYAGLFGRKDSPVKIGAGINPALHLDDTWLSYFDHKTGKIMIQDFSKTLRKKEISLNSGPNKYFIPDAIMVTPNDVLYTDINPSGYKALLLYSFIEKKFQTIYKAKIPGNNINFCTVGDKIIIGEFPMGSIRSGSIIISTKLYNNEGFKQIDPIYSSELGDIGNFHCTKDKVYFIKTLKRDDKLNSKLTEAASLNLKTNEIDIISNLRNVTQLVKMGNLILTSSRGKYYIVAGKEKIISDEIFSDKKLKGKQ